MSNGSATSAPLTLPRIVLWDDWLSMNHPSRLEGLPTYALITLVCNGTRGSAGSVEEHSEGRSRGWQVVRRATFLRWSLAKREDWVGRRKLDKVALAHGLDTLAMASLADRCDGRLAPAVGDGLYD